MKNKRKSKKILSLVIISGYLIGNVGSTFAWGNLSDVFDYFRVHKQNVKKHTSVSLSMVDQKTKSETVSYLGQIKKLDNQLHKAKSNNQQKYLQDRIANKIMIHSIVKKNKELGTNIEKATHAANILKTVEMISSSPVYIKGAKEIVEKKLNAVSVSSTKLLNTNVIKKLGGVNKLENFKLGTGFDPSKVVTFDNIKMLYISNLTLDETLLNCSDPDTIVMGLCGNISNLLSDLTSPGKKLTINDVYKLQVYSSIISKAIYYEGTLQKYKKGAIVLGIDQSTKSVKSIDIVRSYTQYDTANNDVLPIVADAVDINVTTKKPVLAGNDPKIILGLNKGSVVGLSVYPTEKILNIPGVTAYKVMTLKGLINGCSSGYNSSFWYGNGKLGISHDPSKLTPAGTKGIEFNLAKKCYTIFNNRNNFIKIIQDNNGGRKWSDGTYAKSCNEYRHPSGVVSVCNKQNLGKVNKKGQVCKKVKYNGKNGDLVCKVSLYYGNPSLASQFKGEPNLHEIGFASWATHRESDLKCGWNTKYGNPNGYGYQRMISRKPYYYFDSHDNSVKLGYKYAGRTGDGTYWIRPAGVSSAFKVYCDMTTDGGGWTNVNYHFGNIVAFRGNLNGISENGSSLSLINGGLVSAQDTVNVCRTDGGRKITKFTQQFINSFKFNDVKINAKSYSIKGDLRCGGIIRGLNYTGFVALNKFNKYNVIGRCDNDNTNGNGSTHGYSEQTNSKYNLFKFKLKGGSDQVLNLSASCSKGTNGIQVKSIMVR